MVCALLCCGVLYFIVLYCIILCYVAAVLAASDKARPHFLISMTFIMLLVGFLSCLGTWSLFSGDAMPPFVTPNSALGVNQFQSWVGDRGQIRAHD